MLDLLISRQKLKNKKRFDFPFKSQIQIAVKFNQTYGK